MWMDTITSRRTLQTTSGTLGVTAPAAVAVTPTVVSTSASAGTIPAGTATVGVVGGWVGVGNVECALTNATEGLRFRWIPQPGAIATVWGGFSLVSVSVHLAPTLVDGSHSRS